MFDSLMYMFENHVQIISCVSQLIPRILDEDTQPGLPSVPLLSSLGQLVNRHEACPCGQKRSIDGQVADLGLSCRAPSQFLFASRTYGCVRLRVLLGNAAPWASCHTIPNREGESRFTGDAGVRKLDARVVVQFLCWFECWEVALGEQSLCTQLPLGSSKESARLCIRGFFLD